MKIYTLRKPFENKPRSVLNGQLFAVSKETGHLRFISLDIGCHKVLLETSSVQSEERIDDGVIFYTNNETIYDLVDVSTLIPTKAPVEVPIEVCDGFNPENVKVVDEKHSGRGINYCDGLHKTMYTFDQELSQEEFCRFLTEVKSINIVLENETTYPYQPYHVIAGRGKRWEITKVTPYTD